MDQPPHDPLLGALMLALLLVSVAIWLALIARWRGGEPALRYEPRQPVPWGAPVALLTLIFVALPLLAAADAEPGPPAAIDPAEITQRLAGLILFEIAIVAAVLFVVAMVYRADAGDFGLPRDGRELSRDVWLGIVACLAALAPVYGVQYMLLYLTGQQDDPPGHPLIQMVAATEPSVMVVVLVTVAAAVVAPIAEEVLFRLLLQGWLERFIDMRFGARGAANDAMPEADSSMSVEQTILPAAAGEPFPSHEGGPSSGHESSSYGTAALPHGWLPIFLSSLLFALAHFGYGPDPVAIFFLAIILGYVYQRTHRIVPCMVTHALFNSLAMLILWRMVFLDAE